MRYVPRTPLTTSLIPNTSLNIIREIPEGDNTHIKVNHIFSPLTAETDDRSATGRFS